jgi:hypothetical protein
MQTIQVNSQCDAHRRIAEVESFRTAELGRRKAKRDRKAWLTLARQSIAAGDLDVAIERIKAAQALD